jgi:hypothetical protein
MRWADAVVLMSIKVIKMLISGHRLSMIILIVSCNYMIFVLIIPLDQGAHMIILIVAGNIPILLDFFKMIKMLINCLWGRLSILIVLITLKRPEPCPPRVPLPRQTP